MNFSRFDLLKKYTKLFLAFPNYVNILKSLKIKSNNRAIIIGTPVHSNLGDHLIAIECLEYVKKLGYDDIVEIPEFLYEVFPQEIELWIGENDVVFISGGGWLGNIYEDQLVVEDILRRFSTNEIVILPQTIYYSDKGKYSSVERFNEIVKKCESLIFCLREERSYHFVLNNIDIAQDKVVMLPDMALLHLTKIREHNGNNNKIIFSMRNDIERNDFSYDLDGIILELTKRGKECVISSTVVKDKYIPFKRREEYVESKISEYSTADLVVTDRLHSMIFAICAGTKCIVFDNKTKKVSGVFNKWLIDMPGVKMVDNLNCDFWRVLENIEIQPDPCAMDYSGYFDLLSEKIGRIQNGIED